MISTATTAVSMADFSSAISIQNFWLLQQQYIPIGVGDFLLITAGLSIALSLYLIHGKHDMYNNATCVYSFFCTIGQHAGYSLQYQYVNLIHSSHVHCIKPHFLIKDECHRITL